MNRTPASLVTLLPTQPCSLSSGALGRLPVPPEFWAYTPRGFFASCPLPSPIPETPHMADSLISGLSSNIRYLQRGFPNHLSRIISTVPYHALFSFRPYPLFVYLCIFLSPIKQCKLTEGRTLPILFMAASPVPRIGIQILLNE